MTWLIAAAVFPYLLIAVGFWWSRRPKVPGPSFTAASHPDPTGSPHAPEGYPGAVAPNRFVVVIWPSGRNAYAGCVGALARKTYEHAHPNTGEAVEIWDQAVCRGHKP